MNRVTRCALCISRLPTSCIVLLAFCLLCSPFDKKPVTLYHSRPVVLDGELAVPCYPQSAIAGSNSPSRAESCGTAAVKWR